MEHDWPRIKHLATARHAHLVFIDETGFLVSPLLRRTWAPVGQTPVIRQRTRHHARVSVIGGLSVSPARRRLGWYLQFHLERSVRQQEVINFLRDLLGHLRGAIIVIWDRLQAHRSKALRRWLGRCRRLHLEYLPGYAPQLNPIEYGWGYLKHNPLANYCPQEIGELHEKVVHHATGLARRQDLLRSFIHATGLPLALQ